MLINNKHYRTIWAKPLDSRVIETIDQRFLPHAFKTIDLKHLDDFVFAISEMVVRGAPLIGITAAYGLYSALLDANENNANELLENAYNRLLNARPTASNLQWALNMQMKAIGKSPLLSEKIQIALENAQRMADEDIMTCRHIGQHGLSLIKKISRNKNGNPVNILTHCNAGWLAAVDYGTATAPIYMAHDLGIPIHVWVDETRPRNQGAALTAWELLQHGIPHTVIVDNAGGHLMQRGMVDVCIVGSDRTLLNGDVCNKIGTYLKALAAFDNHVPFYVALPSSTLDWETSESSLIPIEERNLDEVKYVQGYDGSKIVPVRVTPKESPASNFAFDITPARLITGLITERGICQPDRESILVLFS
ncbi:MAG TPA: S-methyl-5-thioribose-1-phosphate isomerase [Saprospiraceae bacterium]|nr:S-methyl-5-thioribose-1-phosphate isomerase [Saprospiraceae bacterium]